MIRIRGCKSKAQRKVKVTVKYMENRKIYAWEPWFLIFFGIFHLHRIWGLFDRQSYADFWIGIMQRKGVFYFGLMGVLALLSICGIVAFFKNRKNNYWWRWVYFGGGSETVGTKKGKKFRKIIRKSIA